MTPGARSWSHKLLASKLFLPLRMLTVQGGGSEASEASMSSPVPNISNAGVEPCMCLLRG